MGGYTGARQGVALNTDERLRRKDFQIAGPPALRRNVIPLKHKTHSNRPYTHTHTSYQISGEYARGCGCQACDEAQQLYHEIPMCASTDLQGCQRRVCSRTCTYTLFSFFFAYADVLEISAFTPDLAHSRGYTPCVPHTRMHAYLHMAF